MAKRQLWMIIGSLILVNFITFGFAFIKGSNSLGSGKEAVATIGKEKITKQKWFEQLESRHGEEVLKELIDEKIVLQSTKKHGIDISDAYLDRELTMLKTMYRTNGGNNVDGDEWKDQLKLSLLLEELLTQDVVISEGEKRQYYVENSSRYMITPSFHVSHIVVGTEEEAEQIRQELQNGASFSVLAMERSLDEFTANQGGEIGFISETDERYAAEFISVIKNLEKGTWSEPVKVDEGFAVILLHDHIEGKTYAFEEVEDQIRRQIAIEQMEMPISTKPYWDELGVEWFYSDNNKK